MRALLLAKCPRCRRGNMFVKGLGAYPFVGQMHAHCPHCGLRFEREPGQWQGAMYTGYAISVATMVSCFVAVYVLGQDPATWVYIATTVMVTLLLAPLNYRYSRVMMMHWFAGVTYDPEAEAGRKQGA